MSSKEELQPLLKKIRSKYHCLSSMQLHPNRLSVAFGLALTITGLMHITSYFNLLFLDQNSTIFILGIFISILICPCFCGKKYRKLVSNAPSFSLFPIVTRSWATKERKKKMTSAIAIAISALVISGIFLILGYRINLIVGSSFFLSGLALIFFGITNKAANYINLNLLSQVESLPPEDLSEQTNENLELLIEHCLFVGQLNRADEISRYILSRSEREVISEKQPKIEKKD